MSDIELELRLVVLLVLTDIDVGAQEQVVPKGGSAEQIERAQTGCLSRVVDLSTQGCSL